MTKSRRTSPREILRRLQSQRRRSQAASKVKEPAWISKIKSAPPIVYIGLTFTIIISFGTVFDAIGKMRGILTTSDALAIADNTTRSAFSEKLVQIAWRRLFWADNFRGRVMRRASIADIDDSWRHYIDADADWNANLMIFIVGLERLYNGGRANMLEAGITPIFAHLDQYMATLRYSDLVNDLRNSKDIDVKHKQRADQINECVSYDTQVLRMELYELVRCFSPTDVTRKNICSESGLDLVSFTSAYQGEVESKCDSKVVTEFQ